MQEVGGSIPPGSTICWKAWKLSSPVRSIQGLKPSGFPPGQYGPDHLSPSSRGLGHCPFTAATGVRIPLGTPSKSPENQAVTTRAAQAAFFVFGTSETVRKLSSFGLPARPLPSHPSRVKRASVYGGQNHSGSSVLTGCGRWRRVVAVIKPSKFLVLSDKAVALLNVGSRFVQRIPSLSVVVLMFSVSLPHRLRDQS